MTLIPDEDVFAPATVAEVKPVVHRRLPGADVTSDQFDATVVHLHGPDEAVDRATAYAIARDLRGGADVDRSAPTQWHVRAMKPLTRNDANGNTPDAGNRVGTVIWLSRTYPPPGDYDETGRGTGEITAPGIAA